MSAQQDVLVDWEMVELDAVFVDLEDREMVMVDVEEVLVSGGFNFNIFFSIVFFSLITSSFSFLTKEFSFFM